MSVDLELLVQRLLADRPAFHSVDGRVVSSALVPGALFWLARDLRPGQSTLETGCGASTVVFAAAGTRHTVISPDPDEHDRIKRYCAEAGIETVGVRFIEGTSDAVLPSLIADGPLHFVLIDGAHAFPHPILDWHYLRRRLRPGGVLLLDDIPIPAVGVLFRHVAADPAWRVEEIADERAAVLRKTVDEPEGDDWPAQAFNRAYPDYFFLPVVRRLAIQAQTRRYRLLAQLARRVPALRRLRRRP